MVQLGCDRAMPLTRVQRSVWNTGDNIVVDVLGELPKVDREGIVFVSGGLSVNDGSGGWFKYELTEPRTNHDGNDIIDPTGAISGRGCWVRQKFYSAPAGISLSEVQVAASGQTDFQLHQFTYTPGKGEIAVYVNGTRLTPFAFTEANRDQVNISMPLRKGDTVEIIVQKNPQAGTFTDFEAINVQFNNAFSGLRAANVQEAIDALWIDVTHGTGGGGTGGGTPGFVKPTAGTAAGWVGTAGTEPTMTPGQIGRWIDITTETGFTGFPLTIAAPVNIQVGMSDGTIRTFTIPAKTYPDASATDGGSQGAVNGLGWQLMYEGFPPGIAGTLPFEDGGKLYLRVDVAGTSPVWPVSKGAPPPAGGVGGGAGDARYVTYMPVAPDVSVNVQDALHWVQKFANDHVIDTTAAHQAHAIGFDARRSGLPVIDVQDAIDEVFERLFSGKAIDVSFDPTTTIWVSTNVQEALEEVSNVVSGHKKDLDDHINDPTKAHDSSAIGFTHTLPLYGTANNVQDALYELNGKILGLDIPADHVKYDGTKVQLPAIQDADVAFTSIFTDIATLKATSITPDAGHITYTPTTGLRGRTVQAALDEVGHISIDHINKTAGAHEARAIRFDTTTNGWSAGNVQDAILKASGLSFGYRGHADVTAAWVPIVDLKKGDVFTCSTAGTVHTDWQARIANIPPNVIPGSLLYYDGTQFHYLEHTDPGTTQYIQRRPIAGISQDIVVAAGTDNALVLTGVTGQTAPLLIVNGEARLTGDVRSSGDVFDSQGTVRQIARNVPFSPTGLNMFPATIQDVQGAFAQIDQDYTDHIAATSGTYAHPAQRIQFHPITDNPATDVQGAIVNSINLIDQHRASTAAHGAGAITFDTKVTSLTATNVQDSIDEFWNDLKSIDGGTF